MPTYEVISGKHQVGRGDSRRHVRQGDRIELPRDEAEKFPGKFREVAPAAPPAPRRQASDTDAAREVGGPNGAPTMEDALVLALERLPEQIASGEYKDPEYVVTGMKFHFRALFTAEVEAQVRAMFPPPIVPTASATKEGETTDPEDRPGSEPPAPKVIASPPPTKLTQPAAQGRPGQAPQGGKK